jgi:putative heme-binding domain-containing protein
VKTTDFLKLGIILPLFLACTDTETIPNEDTGIEIKVPSGFELETLYNPTANNQGSWVALAGGPGSTMFASDQNGSLYTFTRPETGEILDSTAVKPLPMEIGHAHGLIWAFNSLYVAVNKSWEDEGALYGSGIYRIQDTDNDGELDSLKLLLKLEGAGEHGPHSFVLAPDGKQLYFVAGNHTLIPESVTKSSRLPVNWGEDNLFEPFKDARGHATDIEAPGGWIARFNEDGSGWELISAGYRNPFDIAFNPAGELFAYDSDMEWDIGMPWYRPTRICHVTSGSEYGWRTGSGKWPAYYPDNLPGVVSLAQGSPTGVLSGSSLDFPSKYKHGLFVADWSFGTLYYIDLQEEGSSYTARKVEFLSGVPLPLTDLIAGADGHLYFATGGRGLDSRLYRLSYTGPDTKDTGETAENDQTVSLRRLRHSLEGYHESGHEKEIGEIWEHLNHEDRYIRYAARIALEHQPVESWIALFRQEKESGTLIQAGIALARQGGQDQLPLLLDQLNSMELIGLKDEQRISLLRNYGLAFIRMGAPPENYRRKTIQSLQQYYPHADTHINRELSQLLLFLRAEGVVPQLVDLLDKHTENKTQASEMLLDEAVTYRSEQYGPAIREVLENMPPSEAIWYGLLLSHAEEGWTDSLRERYFSWFYEVLGASGGMSFKAYMENVRLQAMNHVPNRLKDQMLEISGNYSPSTIIADLPQPIGPGGQYDAPALQEIIWGDAMDPYKGSLADGKRAYEAALCVVCHRMNGEGGATGPDLSQVHTKFGSYDLLFAIFSPNDAITDQYAFSLFHLNDGKMLAGRVLSEEGDSIVLAPNPLNPSYSMSFGKDIIVKRELSPISPMPPGLLNRLNEQEIADLFAYLMSGADSTHEIYTNN